MSGGPALEPLHADPATRISSAVLIEPLPASATDRKVLAVARSYDDLRDACAVRRYELGLSQIDVDEIGGLASGYTGKLEAGMKKMGAMSLAVLLQALGLELVVVRTVPHHLRHSAKQAA